MSRHPWAHVIFSTFGQWVPGDARGFRDHHHRIHSDGDYKNPAPLYVHAGLRWYNKARAGTPISIPSELRQPIVEALASKFLVMETPPRIIAVGATHVHAVIRIGDTDAKPFVGRAKQFASHQVRDRMPGHIWGKGCRVDRITDMKHYRVVVDYVREHVHDGAAIAEHPSVAPNPES